MTDKLKEDKLSDVTGGKHNTPKSESPQEFYSFSNGEKIFGDRTKISYYIVLEDVSSVYYAYNVPCDFYVQNKLKASNVTVKACALDSLRKDYNN